VGPEKGEKNVESPRDEIKAYAKKAASWLLKREPFCWLSERRERKELGQALSAASGKKEA